MTDKPKLPPPVSDPDNVPEILCDGRFYLHPHGNLATITFTHSRPSPEKLFANGTLEPTDIVRARITLTIPNLIALRALLNEIIKEGPTPMPAGGGTPPTQH